MDSSDSDPTPAHGRGAMNGSQDDLAWPIRRFEGILLAQAQYHVRQSGNLCDSKDLVQEAWIITASRLAELGGTLRPGERATPRVLKFLSTTLLRLHNSATRRQIRQRLKVVASEDSDALQNIPEASPDILTRLAQRETVDAIYACIADLPEEDQRIFVVRGIEQNPPRIAGQILGLKPNTVSVRYNRILGRLRERLPNSVFDDLLEDPVDVT